MYSASGKTAYLKFKKFYYQKKKIGKYYRGYLSRLNHKAIGKGVIKLLR